MERLSDIQHLLIVMETLDDQIARFIEANHAATPEIEHIAAALLDRLYALSNHLAARGGTPLDAPEHSPSIRRTFRYKHKTLEKAPIGDQSAGIRLNTRRQCRIG